MQSEELIRNYLLGSCKEQEVAELERRLREDEELQDRFLREAEIDAHLRQEAQSAAGNVAQVVQTRMPPATLWKWVSGVSTLAATILLALFLFGFPHKSAMAFPSLGNIIANLDLSDSIWLAAGTSNRDMLHAELRKGVLVDAKLNNELTPLHVAALFGQAEATGWLLDEKADVSIANSEGNTALHMAAFLGNTDIVQQLLEAGANPSSRNELGFNSVDLAASPWNAEQEEYLEELADRIQTKFDLERIRSERRRVLKLLVNAGGNEDGAPSDVDIFEAVLAGNLRAVEQHISAGTDLNQKEGFGGNTPLMLAALYGKTEIAKALLDARCELNLQNKAKGTALHQACFFSRPQIVEMLLSAGADTEIVNFTGLTARELVDKEFDEQWKTVYEHTYDTFQFDLDFDALRQSRSRIRKIFSERSESKN